jgi:hypothetical protein
MFRYIFHGIVAPLGNARLQSKGARITFPLVASVQGVEFSFHVNQSEVTIDCDVPRENMVPINILYMFAYYLVRGAIEGDLFLRGRGTVLVITSCTIPGATKPQELDFYEDQLEKRITVSSAEYWKIASVERGIEKHIHDLVDCIVNPLDSEMNCGRAIEGLAQLLLPGAEPKQRWIRLREALNLDRSYTQPISDASAGPRHGAIEPQSLDLIVEIRRRSWTIANRFFEFRKRGNINLVDPDFPLLVA